ncbi:MAG TPA: cytochrome c peroxidase [Gallionella sp.]|nr:cytochrome c peroxidase [Gallionella sp.]
MHAGLEGFMNVGIALLAIGFAVLLSMMHFELGPMAGLAPARKWVMTLMLGSGMVAFSIKLAIVFMLSHYPAQFIHPASVAAETTASRPAVHRPVLAVAQQPYVWRALPQVAPAPDWNPTTPEKVALGERLFHDPALSFDRTVSCSSCHEVRRGAGTDGRRTSRGIGGQSGSRNAPTVWNAAFQSVLFWDGRARSLEEQAGGPPFNPKEMGMPSPALLEQRVREDADYRAAFARVFGAEQPITLRQITAAIAAYERTLITPDAPYDRFVRGDLSALNAAQLRGMELFQSLGCIQCHSGPNFSGASLFKPMQAAQRLFPVFKENGYTGRYALTQDVGASRHGSSQGVWRIPSLRNVALTAPYFHNGSVDSLAEAVRIMATVQRGRQVVAEGGGVRRVVWSAQDKTIARVGPEPLSERDVRDVVAFLESLSSESLAARIGQP